MPSRWIASASAVLIFALCACGGSGSGLVQVKKNASIHREPKPDSDVIYEIRRDADGKFPVLELLSKERQLGYYHVRLEGRFQSGWIYKSSVRPLPTSKERLARTTPE
jgi:hypothetical protein